MSKQAKRKYEDYALEVQIPSKGKPYGDLLLTGKIKVYPMTTKEEQLIATGMGDMVRTINQVVSKLIELPDGLEYDLIKLIDRFVLLIAIREQTYGNMFYPRYNCPHCGKLGEIEIDLSNLSITFADDDWMEPFSCKLPISKKDVTLKMMDVGDEKALSNLPKSRNVKDLGNRDRTYIFRIAHQILTVNGEELPLREKVAFVESMHGRDSNTIDNVIRDHELGPDDLLYTCPACLRESEVGFPMDPEFFRPRKTS